MLQRIQFQGFYHGSPQIMPQVCTEPEIPQIGIMDIRSGALSA